MTFGARVLGSAGYIQIDDNYSNYGLVQSGTATTSSKISLPNAGSPTAYLILVRIQPGQHIRNVSMMNDGFYLYHVGASFSFEYRAFLRNDLLTPGGGYGFRVFKPNGALAFDGAFTYARLRSVSIINTESTSFPLTIPGIGVNPWIYVNSLGLYKAVNSGVNVNWYDICVKLQADYSVQVTSEFDFTQYGANAMHSPEYIGTSRPIILAL